jgi:hypothetical protein
LKTQTRSVGDPPKSIWYEEVRTGKVRQRYAEPEQPSGAVQQHQ